MTLKSFLLYKMINGKISKLAFSVYNLRVRTGVQRGLINPLPQIRAFGRVRYPGRVLQQSNIQ